MRPVPSQAIYFSIMVPQSYLEASVRHFLQQWNMQ